LNVKLRDHYGNTSITRLALVIIFRAVGAEALFKEHKIFTNK